MFRRGGCDTWAREERPALHSWTHIQRYTTVFDLFVVPFVVTHVSIKHQLDPGR